MIRSSSRSMTQHVLRAVQAPQQKAGTARCLSRAASASNLSTMMIGSMEGGGGGDSNGSNHLSHSNYFEKHHPRTALQQTMTPHSRSYGTTLQLTSLDEPSTSPTWSSPLRHVPFDNEIMDDVSTSSTVSSYNNSSSNVTTNDQGEELEWSKLHGYIPSDAPATTEDGGDTLLDVPSAAAEVASMLDTSYYHASYSATRQKSGGTTSDVGGPLQ